MVSAQPRRKSRAVGVSVRPWAAAPCAASVLQAATSPGGAESLVHTALMAPSRSRQPLTGSDVIWVLRFEQGLLRSKQRLCGGSPEAARQRKRKLPPGTALSARLTCDLTRAAMSEAFAPEAARTTPAPDDREGLSERTVRIGTSIFGARFASRRRRPLAGGACARDRRRPDCCPRPLAACSTRGSRLRQAGSTSRRPVGRSTRGSRLRQAGRLRADLSAARPEARLRRP